MNTSKNSVPQPDDVVKVIDWTNDGDTYTARVLLADGTETTMFELTQDEWNRVKYAEAQADLAEANAPSMRPEARPADDRGEAKFSVGDPVKVIDDEDDGGRRGVVIAVDDEFDPENPGRDFDAYTVRFNDGKGDAANYANRRVGGGCIDDDLPSDEAVIYGKSLNADQQGADESLNDTDRIAKQCVISLATYDLVEEVVSWVKVNPADRMADELTHFVHLRLTNNTTRQGYITSEQWQDIQAAEFKHTERMMQIKARA